ncbi:MAG: geranylgeranylglycerol-phosphate geranylgeranyltransferase [Flavobacteriales bacterium]|nr:geranylgeranylglycerol-phosphate geranylgeranyltransferase [Flavobacteriales bacterium]
MTYLRLVRWPNLLMVGLIFVLAKTQIVDPISELLQIDSCLSVLDWLLFSLATVLIAASGNVVNDIFDQDIDRINKPDKRIVGNLISEEKAWNFYYALGSAGLGIGMYLCRNLGNVSNSLIFMLAAGGLYFYSYSYKRQLLIGNVVVALLAGLVPFMPMYFYMMCNPDGWMQLPWSPILIAFAFFSFISTLIREIIKDMEDIKGDQLLRCQTLPIVIGIKPTKAIVVFLIAVLMLAIGKFQWAWWQENDLIIFFYFLLGVQLPALALAMQVARSISETDFHKSSTLAKVLMVGGILAMPIFRTLF